MGMKKKLMALLCALTVMLGLALPGARADWDDGLIFIAVNIRLLPLSGFMPITVNGSVYVPATVFDAGANGGISLGIYSNGPANNVYKLYDRNSKFLTFDLTTGNSYDYDIGGEPQACRAVMRNGKIYVSAASVCIYFGLDYTYSSTTPYGYPMVRIKSKDSAFPGMNEFINAASASAMQGVLNDYYKTVTQQTGDPAITAPTVPGIITPPAGNDSRSNVVVRLAVRMETGASGGAVLDALRAEGRTALLLFPPDRLAQQDDLIRRAVGEGHAIGLLLTGGSAEEASRAIRTGNELLAHIARIRTRMVLLDGGDSAVQAQLEGEGYLCWTGNIDGVPNGRSAQATGRDVVREAEGKKTLAAITADDSAESAAALAAILRTVRTDEYSYRAVVETEF